MGKCRSVNRQFEFSVKRRKEREGGKARNKYFTFSLTYSECKMCMLLGNFISCQVISLAFQFLKHVIKPLNLC